MSVITFLAATRWNYTSECRERTSSPDSAPAPAGGDEGSPGNGPCLVRGFGFRLATGTSVEVDLIRAQHERNIACGPLGGTATGVFGDLVRHFGEGRAQVFVMGSAGLSSSRTAHTFSPSCGTAIVARADDNSFAWAGGAGVEIFPKPQLSLRPQFRIVFSEAAERLIRGDEEIPYIFHLARYSLVDGARASHGESLCTVSQRATAADVDKSVGQGGP